MTQTKVVAISPPPELLKCAAAPDIPDEITGQNVGEYILKLHDAYRDCQTMLTQVRAWVESQAQEE